VVVSDDALDLFSPTTYKFGTIIEPLSPILKSLFN
jgi:hypothetical protein